MISIIIPFYNEEKILSENSNFFRNLSDRSELIFADGQSTDSSASIAKDYGKVVSCKKGRARQMNHGASLAQNNILFFLHADNFISVETLDSMESNMLKNNFIGGCLTQRIDKNNLIYRFVEGQGNIRARISKIFYGDQGIFVRKDAFLQLGGFPEVPIMEDVLFSKKLRQLGRVAVLPDKIFVSSRRWDRNGIIRTVLLYNWLIILFHLRVPLEKIRKLYDDLR